MELFQKTGVAKALGTKTETKMATRRVLRVHSPMPLGEVTLVPPPLSGRSESELARAMAAALSEFEMPSASDVLGRLRQAFPLSPLTARVAALGIVMERGRHAN
jgi:hypothetical protein